MYFSAPLLEDINLAADRRIDIFNKLKGANIFMTGGTGFVGKWTLATLIHLNKRLNLGLSIVVLSRSPSTFTKDYPEFSHHDCISFLPGDVVDFTFPEGTFSHIIHAATSTKNDNSIVLSELFDSIVNGTRRVLDFSKTCGANKFLFLSSGAIYGQSTLAINCFPEDFNGAPNPLNLAACYGHGKRAAETLCAIAAHEQNIDITIARGFSFVGPYLPLDTHLAIGNFIYDSLYREAITIRGDGLPVRSYLYAADMVVWLLTILVNGQSGEAYNVGSDYGISLHELALRISALSGENKPVNVLSPKSAENRSIYVPSIERSRGLGLDVWTSLDDAIHKTARWAHGNISG